MSDSVLYPIQSWLWSELDDLGIDGVIYSRHILDMLTSSKHSLDLRLDEKERTIFSKIVPSGKKRKHKYSRRCNSFSSYEEILWKKENAVSCLLSAAETQAKAEETQANIQQVIDELYSRLAVLHLSSDFKKANSSNELSIDVEKSGRRENYEDAFPSLDGSNKSPVPKNVMDSVWNKTERKVELKSGCDSDNSLKAKPPHPTPRRKPHPQRRDDCGKQKQALPNAGSRLEGDLTKGGVKKTTAYPLCVRSPNRRYKSYRKPNISSADCANSKGLCVTQQQQKRPPRSRCPPARFQSRIRRNDSQRRRNSEKWYPQRKRFAHTKNVQRSQENMKKGKGGVSKAEKKLPFPKHEMVDSQFLQDYMHLPSWMESALFDFSAPYVWGACDNYGFPNPREDEEEEEEVPKEMPFSSQWYRDLDSGLLTFQPRTSSSDRALSSCSSSSLSRPSSSLQEDDNLLKEQAKLTSETSAVLEDWMWCPSPSLWEGEDGGMSPVSRLQTVYRRELMSFGEESHADDIPGRMWDEYKMIFQDLQEMVTQTGQESSEDENGSNVWPSKENHQSINSDVTAEKSVDKFQASSMERESDLLSVTASSATTVKKSNFDAAAMSLCIDGQTVSSCMGEDPTHKSASFRSSIWKYSPTQALPTEEGLQWEKGKIFPHDNELAKVMEHGAFGYQCRNRTDARVFYPQNLPCSSFWWSGDEHNGTDVTIKPDTPQQAHEEQLMDSLVNVLLADMGFDLLDPDESPILDSERKTTPQVNPSLSFVPDDFESSLGFGFRSFVFGSPIENFHPPDSNPWRPRWDIDDLFSHAGFTQFPPFGSLDDLFLSLSSMEDSNPYGKLGEATKKGSVLDSVTDNDAWRTSLRIGNVWQTISGIRPVNVIYSENRPEPGYVKRLTPSATTHFRPISTTQTCETDGTLGYGLAPITDTLNVAEQPAFHQQEECDLMALPKINSIKPDPSPIVLSVEEPNFRANFGKLVHDKSMQTSFELGTRDIPSCQQFVLPRPPKTNSR